jgi:polysaccharide pyruvyl transferase WcaK-like protein
VIDEIRACIRLRGGKDIERGILEKTVNSFEDLFSCLSMIDLAVASRFHGIIFSYLMRKPVLGIAYHPKTIDLMDQLGQGEYVLDIGKFDVETMITRFSLLESRSKIVKEEIDQRISRCRTLLDDQYALLHRVMEEGWDPLRA